MSWREDVGQRDDDLRERLEEVNQAIAELERQDLSPDGTPDRWEWLRNHRAQRMEIMDALQRGSGEQRDGGAERLRGVEMRMESLRAKVGDRDWTDEERGQMKRLEDIAAELRESMGKRRGRPQGPSSDKRRRGNQNSQRPQMHLAAHQLEHADGYHVADLVIKFLPDGSEIAYDENTRHLIVLTYGPGVEYVPYLLERLDAPAVAVPAAD